MCIIVLNDNIEMNVTGWIDILSPTYMIIRRILRRMFVKLVQKIVSWTFQLHQPFQSRQNNNNYKYVNNWRSYKMNRDNNVVKRLNLAARICVLCKNQVLLVVFLFTSKSWFYPQVYYLFIDSS